MLGHVRVVEGVKRVGEMDRRIPDEAVQSLKDSFSTWDRSAAALRVQQAESLRSQFLEVFPLAVWPDLPLERYALGQQVDGGSVSWWLEFKTKDIASMSGGSSAKHLIFKGADGQWRFPNRYGSVEEAWSAVRQGFVDAFSLAERNQFDGIWGIEALYGAPSLRTKALYMYYPEKFIPVCSSTHLHHFLDRLGQQYDSNWVLGTNLALLETLRSLPWLDDLSNQELMFFLYHWADPRTASQFVKIAPGEQARFWDECLAGGYICVGWDDVGDLRSFRDKEEFRGVFADRYGATYSNRESSITRKSNELWTLMTLAPGDRIVANRGISEILAVGTVTDSGYDYRADREEYRHTAGVEWDTFQARTIEPIGAWRTTTVSKITPAQFGRIFSGTQSPADLTVLPIVIEGVMLDIESALKSRGQVILYGPPGTGKTFMARRAAVWFAEGGSSSTDAARLLGDETALQKREKEISVPSLQAAKVWFMVANPANWSWDQLFDDGAVEYSSGRLQSNFAKAAVGDLVVCYEASPVRQVVGLARVTGTFDHSVEPDRGLELELVTRITNGPDFASLRAHPVIGQSQPLRNQCQGTLFSLSETESNTLLELLSQVDPDVKWHLTASAAQLTRVTFHPSYTYEDFIEGFRPEQNDSGGLHLQLTNGIFKRVCAAAEAEPERPFVVLIDEINRGNIAKIFGELITLIEHDKRGMKHLLAQSGEDFNVPPNVFIIGTMNTADRSIQLLDTALRRRFRFIELMPDTELLEGTVIGGLSLADFLDELNARIRAKVGRERQVGHAVFFQNGAVITSPEAFAATFRHEILPLVQEYLYDNYADLADVFGTMIIDAANERVTGELDDALALCAALGEHFGAVGT